MAEANKKAMLEEKNELSREEIIVKIARLDGYIKKTEGRIKVHEKALNRLRDEMRKEIQKTMKSFIKGKIYG